MLTNKNITITINSVGRWMIHEQIKNLESTLFEEGIAEAEANEKAGDVEKKNWIHI